MEGTTCYYDVDAGTNDRSSMFFDRVEALRLSSRSAVRRPSEPVVGPVPLFIQTMPFFFEQPDLCLGTDAVVSSSSGWNETIPVTLCFADIVAGCG